MAPDDIVPNKVVRRVLQIAMHVERPVVEALKTSVGAVRDEDVRFFGAKAEYMLKIAKVLYEPKESVLNATR